MELLVPCSKEYLEVTSDTCLEARLQTVAKIHVSLFHQPEEVNNLKKNEKINHKSIFNKSAKWSLFLNLVTNNNQV